MGSFVPWRDAGSLGPGFVFTVEGYTPADGEENPRGRMRMVAPGFFAVLGVPIVAGRDFTDDDRRGGELVMIVSQSVAAAAVPERPRGEPAPVWTDPVFSIYGKPAPSTHRRRRRRRRRRERRAGTGADDLSAVWQIGVASRLFVHAAGDPYVLVPAVTRVIRELSADQPVERAATLADVRADVLSPERLNAFVFSVFAGVALLIAVVGVAGVLAFSVSARTREFGVRLAVGSSPRHLLAARAGGGRAACRDRDRRRRRGRLRARARGRDIFRDRAAAERAAVLGAAGRPRRRRRPRLADTGRARLAGRRPAGAPFGVGMQQ